MRIDACYDSHVHWAATGEFTSRLRLDSLESPREISGLQITPQHMRGDWLLGFGWDENKWSEKPTRAILDQLYPNTPVAFSRCDAHALWVNTEALKRAGLFEKNFAEIQGGRIDLGSDGMPSGVLIDQAREPVEKLIPELSSLEMRRHLLRGVKTFNEAGFTHIRDMTCNEQQWNEAVKLDESGLLTLAVEEYFWLKDFASLAKVLPLTLHAREAAGSGNLRVKGLKLFLDGALGSEGAWLSRCYHGSENRGLILWDREELRQVLLKCWENKLEVALHAIGDEAADWLLNLVIELKAGGKTGKFHIEHAELLRPETVLKMKGLEIECHLQPAHWLSDKRWLKNKIGALAEFAFPWRRLQENDVIFDFGSDAPIEPASLSRTFQALRESADSGVPRLLGGPIKYMGHTDLSWAPNSYTTLEEEAPSQVVFRGEHLL
ncbi:MAG: amidohydrolase [Bdellovibrionales bacterium]